MTLLSCRLQIRVVDARMDTECYYTFIGIHTYNGGFVSVWKLLVQWAQVDVHYIVSVCMLKPTQV